jgi:hypothetical protein
MDSPDGPSASFTSVLLDSPVCPTGCFLSLAFLVAVPRCCVCGWCSRPAMMRFPFLVCKPLPPYPMLQLPPLPKAMGKFPFRVLHTILLWFLCDNDDAALIPLPRLSRVDSFTSPLFVLALNLPRRPAAGAVLDMGNIDLLLLLAFPPRQQDETQDRTYRSPSVMIRR